MEPINSRATFETESIARKQVYYENKKDKANRCELLTCECGGKFQRKWQTKHSETKMHINFRLMREAEETIMHVKLTPEEEDEEIGRQEIEEIKERELRDNNAEAETWIAEDLQREKEKAEEDARLDAEYEAWAVEWEKGRLDREAYEAWYAEAIKQGYKDRSRTHADDLIAMFELRIKAGDFSPPVKIEPAEIPKVEIPEKKSRIVMMQVSKEFKTREERVKFDLEANGTIADIQERVKYRGGNFGRFRL